MPGSGVAPSLIRTPEHRLRVFVSSTLKELAEERKLVREAILELHLVPVMFEAGARPYPARELYRAYLSQSHIFIGIYGQSYGWVGPGMDISGLEDEYNLSSDLPRLIYIKRPAPDREPGLKTMLARLQDENTASYKQFNTSAELAELVENDLALLLSESFESAHVAALAEFTPQPLTNVPMPRNPLLGRETELATVCGWLSHSDIGLVTLTGTGGAGKSRLALEAALALRDAFVDGVYLVRLSPISDPARVAPAIAETLGLRESPQSRPIYDVLLEFLRDRKVLLLLDNFEQLMAAAPRVADLMERCPRVKVLVTSRAPMHIRGEKELQIQPLATPDLQSATDMHKLSQFASVELFIQRAQGLRPEFRVTEENAPAIAEICNRLDGLPLAIELAAARIKLLSPQELLARLGHRFEILRGGTRDLPERHQTLRAAIDWSYNLLAEPARALFRRLAVFSGGWSLEAAEAICNCDDDPNLSIIDEVEALVDFSILTHVEGVGGQARFGMLRTIRDYALERLVESGESERMNHLHAEYFHRFAADVEPRIRTAERQRWQAVAEQDLDNIRAAIQWSLSSGEGEHIGIRITMALGQFWTICGHASEVRQILLTLAPAADDPSMPLELRAGIKWGLGGTGVQSGQNTTAIAWLMQSAELARQAGDRRVLTSALLWGGGCALTLDDLPLAGSCLDECLALCAEMGDAWSRPLAMLWLSNVAGLKGETGRARELFDRSLALAERQGDPWLLVAPLADVAQNALLEGDLLKAEATLMRMESILQIVGDKWTMSWVLNELGQVAQVRGDLELARRYFSESLGLGREYGSMIVLVFSLAETAVLLTTHLDDAEGGQREARMRKAAQLCGAVGPFFNHPLLFTGSGLKETCAKMVEEARARVDDRLWGPAFAEGAAAPLDEMLSLAAEELRG